MASNSGCTEVLVEGAMAPNFLRKPRESVMGVSLPQVACGRQWHPLRSSLRAGRATSTAGPSPAGRLWVHDLDCLSTEKHAIDRCHARPPEHQRDDASKV